MRKLTHSSVLASTAPGTLIALASTQADVPWWLWGAWAGTTVIAVAQAVRSDP